MKLIKLILPIILLNSCVTPSSTTRIENNPYIYKQLPPKYQELVMKGQITQGMSKKAVFLAWGSPSRSVHGEQNGASFERWDYYKQAPGYSTSIGGYGGRGWGPHSGGYYGLGVSPRITYSPQHSSTVIFRNDRVSSWESSQ